MPAPSGTLLCSPPVQWAHVDERDRSEPSWPRVGERPLISRSQRTREALQRQRPVIVPLRSCMRGSCLSKWQSSLCGKEQSLQGQCFRTASSWTTQMTNVHRAAAFRARHAGRMQFRAFRASGSLANKHSLLACTWSSGFHHLECLLVCPTATLVTRVLTTFLRFR